MRFHVVSLPHTQTTGDFPSCAFTQKVRRFSLMMLARGHEVFLYAGERNDTPCTEHIPCISERRRLELVGERHYTEADWGHPHWRGFLANAIGQLHERIEPHDFICLIGGVAHRPIADEFPGHLSVEFGIGYPNSFAPYRVFESYAWMHMTYGAEAGRPERADGRFFDAVIPNQVDDIYELGAGDGGYALYVGRLIERKGYRIAQEVCQRLGRRLILAGPGRGEGYGEFVGEVDAAERAQLMAGADALFVPTLYVEPFGSVVIEALACGTPVISTDWGAMTETVRHGLDGYRCRTFGEFCAALERAPGLDRARIRRDALDRYSMTTVSEQYQRYFDRLSTLWGEGWYATSPGGAPLLFATARQEPSSRDHEASEPNADARHPAPCGPRGDGGNHHQG